MDKRYQVFVSSTYEDLHEERREVMQALLALDCIPTGMELFPAADDDSWTHIQRFIAGCDYYVVIVGGRYGSKGPTGKSYTEMEYDYAVEVGLPALAFLHKDPGTIPAKRTEPTDEGRAALAAFREKIEQARHAKYWNSSGELAGTVTLGMASLMKIKPRVGWVRADLVPDESTSQEILKLRRKIEQLETEISETESSSPPGSETLAQGDEMVTVHFRYEVPNGWFDSTQAFSWNNVLSIMGPILIDQASDTELKDKLAEAINNRYRDRNSVPIYSAYPRDEDFQQIKVQLRALGLIREVKHQGQNGKTHQGWTLTHYGDRLMTQVAAIRRGTEA
jgi:Domain of unknown function (DUF4062)